MTANSLNYPAMNREPDSAALRLRSQFDKGDAPKRKCPRYRVSIFILRCVDKKDALQSFQICHFIAL